MDDDIPALGADRRSARSADGTQIAYRTVGDGLPVVVVGGALSTAHAALPIATALAAAGYRGVAVDRRARGDSGDTAPYDPQREAEDVRAVVDDVGGSAVLLGHSSGAVLSLLAASTGLRPVHLFLSEPPFRFGDDGPPADLGERLQDLVDRGEQGEAVATFLLEDVGLPAPAVEAMRAEASFPATAALAQSAVYDHLLVRSVSTPTDAMLGVDVPTTILRGDPTAPMLVTAVERLAGAMPGSEVVVVPGSRDHRLDPDGVVAVVSERVPPGTSV